MITDFLSRKQKPHLKQFTANNNSSNVSNLLEPLVNISSPKPANPTRSNADQRLIQNIENCILMKLCSIKKDIVLFVESIARGMKMENINFKIKGARIHLKPIPGAKSKQVNHYVKPTLDECKYDKFIFYNKQPVYKQLALRWQISKQLSGLNPYSLSNNKNFISKKVEFFLCNKLKITVKPTIHHNSADTKALLRKF